MVKIFNKKIQRKVSSFDVTESIFLTGNRIRNWDFFDKASEKINFVLKNLEKYFNEETEKGFKTSAYLDHEFSEEIVVKEGYRFNDSNYQNEFEKFSKLLEHINKTNYFKPHVDYKSFGFPLGDTLGYERKLYSGGINLGIIIEKDSIYEEKIDLIVRPYQINPFKSCTSNPKRIKASLCRRITLPHKSFGQFFSEFKKE